MAAIAVFAVVLVAASTYWYGDRIVAGLVGAEELPQAEAPALRSTVERLAARGGIAPPRLYIVRDGFPRAFSAGRGPVGSAIGVSTGLLHALPPAELEGVLAHEVAHIRTRDVLVQTPAVVVAAALVELSRVGGVLSRALLFVLGPVASAIVNALLSPKREFVADRVAAELCDAPTGSPTRSSAWSTSAARRCFTATRKAAAVPTTPPPSGARCSRSCRPRTSRRSASSS